MDLQFTLNADAPADVVKDTDTAGFRADVLEASLKQPVIVDFWAPWCGPCKTLGPALEKAVKAARGKVRMVKINIDDNQQLAAQLRIQSIPTVYAFFQGQPVDAFQGAVPESQIKQFIERLVQMTSGSDDQGDPIAEALAQAEEMLGAGEADTAAAIFQQVIQADPENPAAIGGYARSLIAAGRLDDAAQVIAGLTEPLASKAEVKQAKTQLDLAHATAGAGDNIAGMMETLAADPADHRARIDLAMALFAAGKRQAALDELLTSIRMDRQWNDGEARQQLLKLFEAIGLTDKMTVAARRKLSTILFS